MTDPSQTLSIQLANALLGCLCAAVAERPNPPAQCCFRVGQTAAQDADLYSDLCCQGLAYVIPFDSYPTAIFPNMDITRQANSPCGIVSWVQEFKMGILRCAPAGTDTTMPTCAEWNAAALQNLYDAESLRRAICCFRPTAYSIPEMTGLSIVANRMQQSEVTGGCVERWMLIQVELPGDCCPPLPTPIEL